MSATWPTKENRNYHAAADGDLEHRIANFLYLQKVPHSKRLRAEACLGTVVISGRLDSQSEKWRCIQTCKRVAGVIRLIDRLVVPSAVPKVRQKRKRKQKRRELQTI